MEKAVALSVPPIYSAELFSLEEILPPKLRQAYLVALTTAGERLRSIRLITVTTSDPAVEHRLVWLGPSNVVVAHHWTGAIRLSTFPPDLMVPQFSGPFKELGRKFYRSLDASICECSRPFTRHDLREFRSSVRATFGASCQQTEDLFGSKPTPRECDLYLCSVWPLVSMLVRWHSFGTPRLHANPAPTLNLGVAKWLHRPVGLTREARLRGLMAEPVAIACVLSQQDTKTHARAASGAALLQSVDDSQPLRLLALDYLGVGPAQIRYLNSVIGLHRLSNEAMRTTINLISCLAPQQMPETFAELCKVLPLYMRAQKHYDSAFSLIFSKRVPIDILKVNERVFRQNMVRTVKLCRYMPVREVPSLPSAFLTQDFASWVAELDDNQVARVQSTLARMSVDSAASLARDIQQFETAMQHTVAFMGAAERLAAKVWTQLGVVSANGFPDIMDFNFPAQPEITFRWLLGWEEHQKAGRQFENCLRNGEPLWKYCYLAVCGSLFTGIIERLEAGEHSKSLFTLQLKQDAGLTEVCVSEHRGPLNSPPPESHAAIVEEILEKVRLALCDPDLQDRLSLGRWLIRKMCSELANTDGPTLRTDHLRRTCVTALLGGARSVEKSL